MYSKLFSNGEVIVVITGAVSGAANGTITGENMMMTRKILSGIRPMTTGRNERKDAINAGRKSCKNG